MRRGWHEALVSIGCLALLMAALVAFDDRVRRQLSLAFGPHSTSNQLAYGTSQLHDVGWVVFEVVRDQSFQHAPLMIFVLAASVLTLFMLRT
jgi:hypothetical protein